MAILSLALPLLAEEGRAYPDLPGTWKVGSKGGGAAYGLNEAQSRSYQNQLQTIVAVLRSARVFNPQKGFNTAGVVDFCCPFDCRLAKNCAGSSRGCPPRNGPPRPGWPCPARFRPWSRRGPAGPGPWSGSTRTTSTWPARARTCS